MNCSFCEKPQSEVSYLVEGADESICDDCVMQCANLSERGDFKDTANSDQSCSFCQKRIKIFDQVSHIVMGPQENICNECVRLFSAAFNSPSGERLLNGTCAFCGESGNEIKLVGILNLICVNCLDVCKAKIQENPEGGKC